MFRLLGPIGAVAALLAPAVAQDLSRLPKCAEYFDRLDRHYRCVFAAPETKVLLEQSLATVTAGRTEYARQSGEAGVRSLLEEQCKTLLVQVADLEKNCKR